MKRNAKFRIILWGTALLLLLALFFFLLYIPVGSRRMETEPIMETMVPAVRPKVESMDASDGNAITVSNVNIRSAPDMMSEAIAYADNGTLLNILRTETIGGIQWGYIGAPTNGWVVMKYVKMLERPQPEDTNTDAGVTAPVEESKYNAVITATVLNVRTMPSSEAPLAGSLEKDAQILITKQETVKDVLWGYTPAPVNGWVKMEFVEVLESTDVEITTMETTASPENEVAGYGVALDASSIREMEIEWASGSIRIQPMEITEIRISEQGVNQDANPMVWNVRDGQLNIQYSKNTDHAFGMGLLLGEHSKDLVIQVPMNWTCNSLEIDAASASLEVSNLTIREMEFDGASGTCVFENCTVETLDIDTASGDVRFQGSLNQMECDAASANVVLELTNTPKSLKLDTASGDLDVVLPQDAGFTVAMETMSGKFQSDFNTTQRNGNYVAGNGRCRIAVDAMSGDVTIRKGA